MQGSATELSLIRGDFSGTGVDPDAGGAVRAVFTPNNPKLRLDVSGLTPGAAYQLTIDGVLEDTITADRRGGLHLDYRVEGRSAPGKRLLDFDPRGRIIGLTDGSDQILSLNFSGNNEPDQIRVDERVTLDRAETETSGRVRVRYLEQKNQDRFILQFQGVAAGSYNVYVDGQLQTTIDMSSSGSITRAFQLSKQASGTGHGKGKGNPKNLPLDFDPRGFVVDVVRDGAIIYSGEILANIPGVNGVHHGELVTPLTSTGADADAVATATVALAVDRDFTLDVAVAGLPSGSYDVLVGGGEMRSTISVDASGSGSIVFSTDPVLGQSALSLNPLDQPIEIRQGETVYFTGHLGLTMTELPKPNTVEVELPLLNVSNIVTASAHLKLETLGSAMNALEVKLENVPVGTYDFKVNGVLKANIDVAGVVGTNKGLIVFDNHGAELPLDFDPRGQVVTIEKDGAIWLIRPL